MNLIYGCHGEEIKTARNQLEKAALDLFNDPGENLSLDSTTFSLNAITDGGAGVTLQKTSKISSALVGRLYDTLETDFSDATKRIGFEDLSGLSQLHGCYALAILNHDKEELTLATDEGGFRNLYFAEADNVIWFSSHITLLAKALGHRTSIERCYEDFLLSYGFVPFENTFYKGIFEIPVGSALIINRVSGKSLRSIEREDPWQENISSSKIADLTHSEQLNLMETAFLRATKEIAHPSKKAAVLLGGVDSALVAAALKNIGKEVTTYSFFYENEGFNQTHTDTLAKHLDIDHVWIPITPEVISKGLTEFPKKFNRPTNWPNYLIQTEYLCQQIKKDGHEVCYSGDGCDGIFLGYPRTHTISNFLDTSFLLPKSVLKMLEKTFGSRWLEIRLGRPLRVAFNMLRNLSRRPPARGFIPFRILDDLTLKHIRTEPPPTQKENVEQVLKLLSSSTSDLSPQRRAYHGKNSVGVNKNKIAGASDSTGLPILSPYLHPGLSRFTKSLPENLLRPKENPKYKKLGKYLLLAMAENKNLLPNEVIFQPKISAVEGPIDEWYLNELSEQIQKQLKELPFRPDKDFLSSLMYKKNAEKIYTKYFATDHLTTHEISMLVTYASFTAQ